MLDPIKDIIRLIGLPDPALHVLLGIAIYLAAAALFRLPFSSWKPWLVLLGLQLVNEIADVSKDLLDGEPFRWRGSLFDTAVTLAIPTVLVLIPRWRHHLAAPATKQSGDRASTTGKRYPEKISKSETEAVGILDVADVMTQEMPIPVARSGAKHRTVSPQELTAAKARWAGDADHATSAENLRKNPANGQTQASSRPTASRT